MADKTEPRTQVEKDRDAELERQAAVLEAVTKATRDRDGNPKPIR